MRRLLARLRGRRTEPLPDLMDDGSLSLVVEAFDAARADSAVLVEAEAAGTDLSGPVLVRHHLVLPDAAAVAEAAALLADERYRLVTDGPPASGDGRDGGSGGALSVRASRTQVLSALGAAQERSRMAGLAQRLGGDVRGWDACAPPPA